MAIYDTLPLFLGSATKGDMMVFTGGTHSRWVRLPVGTNNYAIVADSTQDEGVAWEALTHGDQVDNPTTAHGATGAVMGTTNTQTVTNKDLTAETNKQRHRAGVIIMDPVAGDRAVIHMNERAITVLGVSFASTGGTSAVISVEYATTIASGTVIHSDTCATSTPEWDVTPSGDATVATDQIIMLEVGTVTGTVDQLHVTIYWSED